MLNTNTDTCVEHSNDHETSPNSMMMIDNNDCVCYDVDTKFKQQRLPAWQPMLTAVSVLPLMFAIGVSFIPLGIAFLVTANNVRTGPDRN